MFTFHPQKPNSASAVARLWLLLLASLLLVCCLLLACWWRLLPCRLLLLDARRLLRPAWCPGARGYTLPPARRLLLAYLWATCLPPGGCCFLNFRRRAYLRTGPPMVLVPMRLKLSRGQSPSPGRGAIISTVPHSSSGVPLPLTVARAALRICAELVRHIIFSISRLHCLFRALFSARSQERRASLILFRSTARAKEAIKFYVFGG